MKKEEENKTVSGKTELQDGELEKVSGGSSISCRCLDCGFVFLRAADRCPNCGSRRTVNI